MMGTIVVLSMKPNKSVIKSGEYVIWRYTNLNKKLWFYLQTDESMMEHAGKIKKIGGFTIQNPLIVEQMFFLSSKIVI